MSSIIFYSSKNNIEKLYRDLLGRNFDEEHSIVSGSNNSVNSKLGLSELLSFIIKPSIEGTFASEKKTTKTIKYTHDSIDNVIKLIEEIETSDIIKDLSKVDMSDESSVYKFNLPVSVSEVFKSNGNGTFIKVTYTSENLIFEGLTSKENWTSESLVNNILFSAESNSTFLMKGILIPVKKSKIDKKIILTCQILLLYGR